MAALRCNDFNIIKNFLSINWLADMLISWCIRHFLLYLKFANQLIIKSANYKSSPFQIWTGDLYIISVAL